MLAAFPCPINRKTEEEQLLDDSLAMYKGFGEAIADALNKLRSSELTLEHRLYSFKFTVVEIAFGIRVRIEDTSRTKWPVAFCDIRGDTADICSRFPTHFSGLMRGYEILPGARNQHGNCCPRPTIKVHILSEVARMRVYSLTLMTALPKFLPSNIPIKP